MSSFTRNDEEMKKFLFDTHDFDKTKPETEAQPVYSEEQMTLARQQGVTQGRQEGLHEARQAQEEQIVKALQEISTRVEKLAAAEDRREAEKTIDAATLAMRIAHKLLPQFARTCALEEIQSVILAAIEQRRDEPRIAVTVPTAHLTALKEKIDAMALEKGYAGKIILLADDAIAETDCRVEWSDGGAERIYERLYMQIETEFTKAIAGIKSTMDDNRK